jgi:hypothetical protein
MFTIVASETAAYPDYASGCNNCHGDFNSGSYTSLADGQVWGTDLMSGHIDNLIGSNDCDVCHTAPGKSPVFLKSSDGGDGLDPISCLGCHGRDEGAGVTGAGLRQHHFRQGYTICAMCHTDADPSQFTTVGEDVTPPYYANPGIGHPDIPDSPCNPAPGYPEDVLGVAGTGLDNDGDTDYDESDTDCNATGIGDEIPYYAELHQNYPNPFNPETVIHFTLLEATPVLLDVFSTDGRLVRRLVSQELPPGDHYRAWDGRDSAGKPSRSGVYYYRLQWNKGHLSRKMILLK